MLLHVAPGSERPSALWTFVLLVAAAALIVGCQVAQLLEGLPTLAALVGPLFKVYPLMISQMSAI